MPSTLDEAAARLARLLTTTHTVLADPQSPFLDFEAEVNLRALSRGEAPADTWAVDGGQCVVADARCLQVLVTRAGRVLYRGGESAYEEEGDLRAYVVGGDEQKAAILAGLGLTFKDDTAVDVNLLRDRWEWDAVARCVDEAGPGALVLIDGDLQPDWRIPSSFLDALLTRAEGKGVTVAAVTKHSSLSRGGAPLVGQLELEAAAALGERSMWWCRVGRTRSDVGGGIGVYIARLDPDATYAFRVDVPARADAETVLAQISALCDDAAFPGYPYPLTVADRLSACPGWLRSEMRFQLDEALERLGVVAEVRERAFADRHHMMERS